MKPYSGNGVWLYNGSTWNPFDLITLAGLNYFLLGHVEPSNMVAGNIDITVTQGNHSFTPGMQVSGPGIQAGTTVQSFDRSNGRVSILPAPTLTQAGATLTFACPPNTNYDVFAYNDPTWGLSFDLYPWLNNNARPPAQLGQQDGAWVFDSNKTRLYLGTIRTTSVAGQCEDSQLRRFAWNYYNRVPLKTRLQEPMFNWTYVGGWRQMRGQAANKIQFVVGMVENPIYAELIQLVASSLYTFYGFTGINLNSTTATPAQYSHANLSGNNDHVSAFYGYPTLGYNEIIPMEQGGGSPPDLVPTFFGAPYQTMSIVNLMG